MTRRYRRGRDDAGQRAIRQAYAELLGAGRPTPAPADPATELRSVVRRSWERSLAHLPEPHKAMAPVVWSDDELRGHRETHPLAAAFPVIQRLLIEPCADTGAIVAVGDEHGRLLWVDGDRATRRRAERILLTPGADWSEPSVGTSAPGTALVLEGDVQIAGAEHFVPAVQEWHCTAVPIHGPTGRVVGVLDVTGGADAADARTLAWLRAAAEAVEAELLRIAHGSTCTAHDAARDEGTAASGRTAAVRGRRAGLAADVPTLCLLGRRQGLLTRGDAELELSLRHTEILAMIAGHPNGLSGEALIDLVEPRSSAITLRAEVSRLRRVLAAAGFADLRPASRPYRLETPLTTDADGVYGLLERGRQDEALAAYGGALLPASDAPGVQRLRDRIGGAVREAVLSDGSVEAVLAYLDLPEAEHDRDAWQCALRLLPAASPRRALVVAHLERLEAELV